MSAASHPFVPALGAPLRQACLHNSLATTFPCLFDLPLRPLPPPQHTWFIILCKLHGIPAPKPWARPCLHSILSQTASSFPSLLSQLCADTSPPATLCSPPRSPPLCLPLPRHPTLPPATHLVHEFTCKLHGIPSSQPWVRPLPAPHPLTNHFALPAPFSLFLSRKPSATSSSSPLFPPHPLPTLCPLPPLQLKHTWSMSLSVSCMASLRPSPGCAPAGTRYCQQSLRPPRSLLPCAFTPALCYLLFPSFIPCSSSPHPLSTGPPPKAATHLVHELVCELHGIPSSQPGVRPCLRQRRQPPTQQRQV